MSIKASGPTDPIPNNLVFHSVFRVDKSHIGILWYDWEIKSTEAAFTNRIMRSAIYDIIDHTWRDVTLVGADLVTFRFGHSLLPLYNEHRIADKVIVVGGIDVS